MKFKSLRLLVCIVGAVAPVIDAADGDASVTPAKQLQVLETQQINLGTRSIFYHRVVPPHLPEPPPRPAPSAPPILSPEEEAALREWEQKEHKFIFLSATVYGRSLTELRWNDETRAYHAFSNIAFNYLTGLNDFATEAASYFFFLGIGNESKDEFHRLLTDSGFSASEQRALRDLERRPASQPAYVLIEEKPASPQNAAALGDLDALHAHYAANRRQMEEHFHRQEAENAARERWLRENPPVEKDTVIYFWKNSRSLIEEGPK